MVQILTKSDRTGLCLSISLIQSYLLELERRGRSSGTRETYQRKLIQLYDLLPQEKIIDTDTLPELRKRLQEQGIPNSSINILCSAANGLLDYCGRRDLQLSDTLDPEVIISPELTRNEYLRLLSAAKQLGKRRTYLLIKVLANIGLYIRELPFVTLQAVEHLSLTVPHRGIVTIASCLQEELLTYAKDFGIQTGPIFVSATGKPLNRSAVHAQIRRLAPHARVDEEKCTPMALRRLYLATQESIQNSLTVLVDQSFHHLLETEQLAIGWDYTNSDL